MQGAVSFFVYGKSEKCTICNQMNKNAIICIFDKSDFREESERKNKNVLHFPENALEVQHKRNEKRKHFRMMLHLCYDSERTDF